MVRFGNHANPIVSRVFDDDLPLASCVKNISTFAGATNGSYNGRLLRVDIPEMFDMKNVQRAMSLFTNCQNLKKFSCWKAAFNRSFESINNMFQNCVNLESDISCFTPIF